MVHSDLIKLIVKLRPRICVCTYAVSICFCYLCLYFGFCLYLSCPGIKLSDMKYVFIFTLFLLEQNQLNKGWDWLRQSIMNLVYIRRACIRWKVVEYNGTMRRRIGILWPTRAPKWELLAPLHMVRGKLRRLSG